VWIKTSVEVIHNQVSKLLNFNLNRFCRIGFFLAKISHTCIHIYKSDGNKRSANKKKCIFSARREINRTLLCNCEIYAGSFSPTACECSASTPKPTRQQFLCMRKVGENWKIWGPFESLSKLGMPRWIIHVHILTALAVSISSCANWNLFSVLQFIAMTWAPFE